jgi:Phycobilisome degradation protein nblA
MNTLALELTLEQQFSLKQYENQVARSSPEQSRELLIEVLRQLRIKDNVIRSMIRLGLA